jgi:uncharacterized repeat protein (TIGR03833 family)
MEKEDPAHFRENVIVGLNVIISLDGNRDKRISGKVGEILTKAHHHPHGMKVRLEDGNIGRVKEIGGESVKEDPVDFDSLVSQGETNDVEYKSSALWSQNLSEEEIKSSKSFELQNYERKASKIILAKTIASFSNTEGGNLIIGIKEIKEHGKEDKIIGIEDEFKKLKNKDYCTDGYRRMILDEVIKPYFPETIFNHLNQHISINFPKKDSKTLCWIKINKGDHKVFLKLNGKDHFFIKVDAEVRELLGREIVDYCEKHFK